MGSALGYRRNFGTEGFVLSVALLWLLLSIPGVPAAPATGTLSSPVAPAVSIVSFTISPNPIMTGATTYLNLTVTGGTGPYIYNYSSGMPSSCPQIFTTSSSTTYSVACVPSTAGTFSILGVVIDLGNFPSSSSKSASLTVTASPVGPTITAFTASPSTLNVGGSTYLNVTATGGSPPYSYVYSGLPPGCSSSSVTSLLCAPTQKGNYTVTVTVTDSNGLSATSGIPLTVNPSLGPTISSFVATPSLFTVGGSTTLNVIATGGKPPYTFSYAALPAGCASANSSTIPCTPTSAGRYNVSATVTDMNSRTSSTRVSLTVNPLPTVKSFLAAPSTFTVGATTLLSTTVTGGTSPYSYTFSSLPPGCASSNTSSLSCTPSAPGSYSPSVQVTDADGKVTSPTTTSITVNGLPKFNAFTASPTSIPLEGTVYLNSSVIGGTPPLQYSYATLPPGCISADTATLSCTPTTEGTFTVKVSVKDASNQGASDLTTFTVTPVPTIVSFSATPSTVAPRQSTTFSVQAIGGSTPYTYVYTGLPVGCSPADTAVLSCIPVASGQYNVTVQVTDAKGNTNSGTTTLQVTSQSLGSPSITYFGATPSQGSVGNASTFTVQVSGGTSPYSYLFSGLPPGCASADSSSLSCTPSSPGSYSVNVRVTDSTGKSTTASFTFTVTGTPEPLQVSLESNLSYVWVGASFTLTTSIHGGVGPFSYAWAINGTNVSGGPASGTWTESLSHGGNYSFRVWVQDGQGKVTESNAVHVLLLSPRHEGTPTSPGTLPASWSYLAVIVAILGLGVLLTFVLLLKRRRSREARAGALDSAFSAVEPGIQNPDPFPVEPFPVTSPETPLSPSLEPAVPQETSSAIPPLDPPQSCPQCQGLVEKDGVCDACGIYWQPSGGPGPTPLANSEEMGAFPPAQSPPPTLQEYSEVVPTLNLCPKCQRPVGPDMACYSCGINP